MASFLSLNIFMLIEFFPSINKVIIIIIVVVVVFVVVSYGCIGGFISRFLVLDWN